MSSYSGPVDSSPPQGNQTSIMNIKSIPTNSAQRVESDILEPLTFSQSEAVWEFAPKGFLHPGSTLSLGFTNNATLNDAFPYPNIGVASLVRRAVLRTTAGRVICDTEDFNYLQGLKSMLIANETNKNRECYQSGRQMAFEVNYDSNSDTLSTEGYGLSNNTEYNFFGTAKLVKGLHTDPSLLHSAGSQYQIKLHQLFPYMKHGNQLPLFMLPDERIQVQIFWSDETDRLALNKVDSDAGLKTEKIQLDKNNCKLISDHIFYDGKTMSDFAEKNKELTFSYFDYRLSKQSLTSTSGSGAEDGTPDNFKAQFDTKNNVRNIGGNGMFINNIHFSYENPNKNSTYLLGPYAAEPMGADGSSRFALESNVFINSEFLYPQTIKNPARQFHNLKEASGMIPFVSRECYSGQGSGGLTDHADGHFEGHDQSAQLAGNFFWNGFLTKGLGARVDNRGIDLHTNAVGMADLKTSPIRSYTQRAWLEIGRYITIKDGHLECYYM